MASTQAVPPASSTVRVVCATRTEARAARRVLPSWLTPLRLGVALREQGGLEGLVGAGAVVSIGVCGALDPGLRAGDLVIPGEIGSPDGALVSCDAELVSMLRAAASRQCLTAHEGRLLTSSRLVTGDRRGALAAAGWVAADMESALLAARGRRLAAVRAVLDTAADELDPLWEQPGRALLRPRLWPQAVRMARDVPRRTAVAAAVVAAALSAW